MKKSSSAQPVSVRFLNSCSDGPAGSGDEGQLELQMGLTEDRSTSAEDAAGDGMSRAAPPTDPAAPAVESQPVPPPRKHSVRSRADGLRDALQDLSPVKEFVSRLGKSRSSSLDSTGLAAAADRPAEQKPTDSDKWSRLTELTEKLTKTVEEKISDYRGSVRSASGAGGGASSDFEILTESDVFEAVREASPSPPPSREAPPASPPPPAASDSLDVAFVNVPSPVAAPAASPARRDFRLASIKPQIIERLQRSVGRPPPPSPPAGTGQTSSVAAPDSVTLSALQGKYIEEEEVDIAEEAVEVPLSAAPVPAERPVRRPSSGSDPEVWQGPVGSGTETGDRPSPPPDLCARLVAAVTGGWRWLVALVAVLLAAPLPGFVSGLLVGAILATAGAAALLPLLRPPARRLRPPPSLTHRRPPVKEYRPTLMHKDWMHELVAGPYEPATHQPTEARFVRLEGSMLRISHPKGHVAKRASCDEHIPNLSFVQQRIYDVAGCEVELQPVELHPTRRWSRRYPLCVRLDNCRRVTRSRGLLGAANQKASSTTAADRVRNSDGERELGPSEAGLDGMAPAGDQRAIYLFARTDRNKEHWFRLLQEATRQGVEDEVLPSPVSESMAAEPTTDAATGTVTDTATPAPAITGSGTGSGSGSSSGSGSGSEGTVAQEQTEEEASLPPPPPPQPSPKLDFDYYMSKLIPPTPDDGPDSRPPSPVDGTGRAPPTAGHVAWFNALIGRLAFDVFGNRGWAAFVQNRVQRKLSRIKPPYFIEELSVTSCDLGSVVPRITSVSAPSCDERGLWTDMTVLYEGGACVTLRTKVNLMKLRKTEGDNHHQQQQQQPTTDGGTEREPVPGSTEAADAKPADKCATYACDRDDDSAEVDSSSDEETDTFSAASDRSSPPASPSPSASTTTPSAAPGSGSSVGKRLMKVVDKVTTSRYFQQAAQNRYVKRYMEEFSNTPLELTVTLRHLQGVVTLNIPRPPSDRIWYGFRGQPDILLSAQPRLGTRDVTLTQVTDWIENKLVGELHKLLVLPNMDDLVVPLLAGETLGSSDDVIRVD